MAGDPQSNMKRVALETGGNSPQIFLTDLDHLDAAVDRPMGGIFDNAGSRLLAQRDIHDEFVQPFMARTARRPAAPAI